MEGTAEFVGVRAKSAGKTETRIGEVERALAKEANTDTIPRVGGPGEQGEEEKENWEWAREKVEIGGGGGGLIERVRLR